MRIKMGSRFTGIVWAPIDRNGGAQPEETPFSGISDNERFDYLMSLALDDMLEPEEAAAFDKMLEDDMGYDDVWGEWKAFDAEFHSTPSVEPPVNFVASFEERLVRYQRRRRLWLGAGLGLIAVLLWGGLVTGLAGAGAYIMFSQSDWLTAMVRYVVYCTASVQGYLSIMLSTISTAMSTAQMQAMILGYIMFGIIALWAWSKLLRRSVINPNPVPTINA